MQLEPERTRLNLQKARVSVPVPCGQWPPLTELKTWWVIWFISVAVVRDPGKATQGERGLLGLEFQVTVHSVGEGT